jgi:hypothetical protein
MLLSKKVRYRRSLSRSAASLLFSSERSRRKAAAVGLSSPRPASIAALTSTGTRAPSLRSSSFSYGAQAPVSARSRTARRSRSAYSGGVSSS